MTESDVSDSGMSGNSDVMQGGAFDIGWQPTRRLPVYVLLDSSASMAGAPIEAVNEGLIQLYNQLLDTPSAVETVWISVIVFGTDARVQWPLVPITESRAVSLSAEGTTSLGAALKLLELSLDYDIKVGSMTEKGDWRPLVFLLTDGEPTDQWEPVVERLKNRTERRIGTFIALGCGEEVNGENLKRITDHVLLMENVTSDHLRSFFKWVSQSVSGASVSAEAAGTIASRLPSLPEGISRFDATVT